MELENLHWNMNKVVFIMIILILSDGKNLIKNIKDITIFKYEIILCVILMLETIP